MVPVLVTKADLRKVACGSSIRELQDIFGAEALEEGVAITRANLRRLRPTHLTWLIDTLAESARPYQSGGRGGCRCISCNTKNVEARISAIMATVAYA